MCYAFLCLLLLYAPHQVYHRARVPLKEGHPFTKRMRSRRERLREAQRLIWAKAWHNQQNTGLADDHLWIRKLFTPQSQTVSSTRNVSVSRNVFFAKHLLVTNKHTPEVQKNESTALIVWFLSFSNQYMLNWDGHFGTRSHNLIVKNFSVISSWSWCASIEKKNPHA